MGINLSSPWPYELVAGAKKEKPDIDNTITWAIIFFMSLYGCMMILTITRLVDRWRGPRDDNPTTLGSVMGAIVLSALWPIVLAILAVSSG